MVELIEALQGSACLKEHRFPNVALLGNGPGWKRIESRGQFFWELGLRDQVQGPSLWAHSRLLRDLRWQQWWGWGWGWVCQCWSRETLQVGEEDRVGAGMAGAPAGDEDTARRTKRTVSQPQRSFTDQPSISVYFNLLPHLLIECLLCARHWGYRGEKDKGLAPREPAF